MTGTAKTLFGTAFSLAALVEPLAAHTGLYGGLGHDLLHLFWGNHHPTLLGAAVMVALVVGAGFWLRGGFRSGRAQKTQ